MVRSDAAMSDKDGNWLKAVSALRLTGEGIEQFVKEGSEECAEEIIREARKSAGLFGKEVCGQCTTHNVLACRPRNGLCNYDEKGNCTYHDKDDPLKESKSCPQGICDKIPNIIKKRHRFHSPNFKNTDARKWFENPWEIIKCFIPTDGYENITDAEVTDASGLLAIVTNCKCFESRVAENLGSPDNAFVKLRDCRNKVFHSPGFNISDRDLQSCMKLMLDVLEDSKFLAHDSEAQQAAEKIREIAESSVQVFCASTDQEYDEVRQELAKDILALKEKYGEKYEVKVFLERDSEDGRTKFEQLHTTKTDQQTDSSQGTVNTSRPKPAIVIVFAKKRTSEVKSADPTSCKPSNTTSSQMTNHMNGDDCKGGGGRTLSGTNDPQRCLTI